MISLDEELGRRLDILRKEGLFRELRRLDSPQSPRIQIGGEKFLNFSSNDYLGLANHPSLKEAATKAIEKFGTGSGASRLISGSLAPHFELEEALAAFKKTEAALSFSTGYAAALGTICALLDQNDVIIIDKLVHASIVDAARLCGAKIRVFAHNDLNDLENILNWTKERQAQDATKNSQVLIVTESVFSMDGDFAPLREIVALKNKFGAWLMVDEAHATGLYGKNRRGIAEEFGVSDQIEIQMGTLGKAVGASGGYICGSRPLIDFLINRARSFIFSTAPVPAASAAALAGINVIQSAEGEALLTALWQRITQFNSRFEGQGSKLLQAIIPILVGDETKAVEAANALRKNKIFIPAIRFPTVARGQARLRLTMTATHSHEEIVRVMEVLSDLNLGTRDE